MIVTVFCGVAASTAVSCRHSPMLLLVHCAILYRCRIVAVLPVPKLATPLPHCTADPAFALYRCYPYPPLVPVPPFTVLPQSSTATLLPRWPAPLLFCKVTATYRHSRNPLDYPWHHPHSSSNSSVATIPDRKLLSVREVIFNKRKLVVGFITFRKPEKFHSYGIGTRYVIP